MTKGKLLELAVRWLRENEGAGDETPPSERSLESKIIHGIVDITTEGEKE